MTELRLRSPMAARRELAAAGIRFSDWRAVTTLEEALAAGTEVGFPVVLKSATARVVHKSDAGLVAVGIESRHELAVAYQQITARTRSTISSDTDPTVTVESMERGAIELLAGVRRDDVFGPVLAVGLGGTDVEVHCDITLRVLPVDEVEIREMLAELRSYPLLTGHRNRCRVDIDAFIHIALGLTGHVAAHGDIAEAELNPVIVRCLGAGAVAVDARIITFT